MSFSIHVPIKNAVLRSREILWFVYLQKECLIVLIVLDDEQSIIVITQHCSIVQIFPKLSE